MDVQMDGWIIGEAVKESVEFAPDTQDAAADVPAGGKEAAQEAPAVEVGDETAADESTGESVEEDEWRGNEDTDKLVDTESVLFLSSIRGRLDICHIVSFAERGPGSLSPEHLLFRYTKPSGCQKGPFSIVLSKHTSIKFQY